MTVFNAKASHHLTAKMFFDPNGTVGIARYDQVKYPELEHLTIKQLGFHWKPEEVDLNTDRGDFQKLTDHEKHIFTSNLKRQILLDSVQGRSPTAVFNSITALPEMETWATTWAFFETIHSRSYTHIIQNIYPNAGDVFDTMSDIKEIADCAKDISAYYDDFIEESLIYQLLTAGKKHVINGREKVSKADLYQLKKKLWLTIMSINILEGIRFYVSFACSWAFAENKRMEGNAKIIKLIARDENLHLSSTQKLIRSILPADDSDFEKIRKETEVECMEMFKSAMAQEKAWARYLFKDGSIIGLNEALLSDYVDYIGFQRMKAIGMTPDFKAPARDPLPWTNSWISSKSVQVAPQETEITSYVVGGVKQDINDGDFGGFEL
jgi:ribonucleoside-diphosphate reductase beta chain